ncbi:hypothetical protein ACIBQX_48810 [Nonomuraea sp. NPDC049714]|uniref:hypothetical protein n=1 Tax=Nonomuraea sp. NPDC049714 TaxID=3364357 RepID=UPI0037876F0D
MSPAEGDHIDFHGNAINKAVGVEHHHHYPPAHEPGHIVEGAIPSRWARMSTWLAGILAVGLGAVLINVLMNPPEQRPVSNPAVSKPLRSGAPLRVGHVAHLVGTDSSVVKVVSPKPLDQAQQTQLKAYPNSDLQALAARVKTEGGAYLDALAVQIRLERLTDKEVRVTNVTVEELRRTDPLNGTVVIVSDQGGQPSSELYFDLDAPVPVAREAPRADAPGAAYFAKRTLLFRPKDKDAILVVHATTSRYTAQFALHVQYAVEGERGVRTLIVKDQDGQPFRVAACRAKPYQDGWWFDYQTMRMSHTKGFKACSRPS